MQFSWMKVAIYLLTFLTYAYSGYGSSTIVHLRDAIIAAEAIFGDVFKNLIVLVRKFRTVHEVFDAAVDENCIYQCPAPDIGGPAPRAVQNKFYTPTADGCGSLGLRISTDYLPAKEMETCCNDHDICYDTCNSDKELCDLDFKRCLYKYCDSYEKSIASDLMMKGCKAAAKMLFTGTLTLGCRSYLDSQQRSCYCAPPKSSSYNGNRQGNSNSREKQQRQKYGWKDRNEI
ncbi:group XIIA secretory phospholipase A2 [Drosophila sechellia]|uniref:GXIVsPLA2, isoform A n=4 Tax=melanogaster subgroup TaxID=32351 RepID=Q9VUV6_DROME|nr:GXIVsPLA2, isoform D [Drosophila melanogaster]NP_648815.1 GXIVsPLA2, isoform A [Drosophila melanogaster]XP_002030652.1 group XIIA secretory phospholipase A2 [Drosophila sechellia]XP_002085025.1 group XIIA secretory phospholipase A2 isoform X2 [Drosophila simulans]XP_033161219.1 group XIIA secretory phospholipase A2 [Drosophila mauritiana]XP_043648480.1 group XIIA secretory phospholipase A2 [Drosophila teissieri]AAF49567.2 GXIVsPLA2, isoform A [Drosophila melanogaster]AAK30169.1 group XIV |eukprot:NP_001261903.1 GXIVsPLA2, isoform D [Drosophila melanogaster]